MPEARERSVRSVLDDPDDLIDSLEADMDDDDEFGGVGDFDDLLEPDPSPAPIVATRAHPRSPCTQERTPTQEGGGGERIKLYRALQAFTQALAEAAPIYIGERMRAPEQDDESIRARVGGLCSKHLNLVERCLEINNADAQDIMLRYQRRTLAKNLAELYCDHPIEHLENLVEIAKVWAAQSKDFENTGSDNSTGDGWLQVKLSLFTATLKYYDEIEGLWCSHSSSEVMLELQRIAIELAKEVAFSWSKRSQVSDRENLFSSALPHCLQIAQMSYCEVAINSLGGHSYNATAELPELPRFASSVDELNMGYMGDVQRLLLAKVRQMARNYLNGVKTPKLRHDDLFLWRNALLEEVDKTLADAWQEATTDLMDDLDELSEEDQEDYYNTHDVMEFSRFEVIAMERLSILDRPGRLVLIDFQEILTRSKKHLAWMWGISDALIAARKDVPQGD